MASADSVIQKLVAIRPDFKRLGVTRILSLKLIEYIEDEMHRQFPMLNCQVLSALAMAYTLWWHTFPDSDISFFASKYDLPILTGPLDPDINDSIVKYLGFHQVGFPEEHPREVCQKYGTERGNELIEMIKKLMNELAMLDIDWKKYKGVGDPKLGKYIRKSISNRHPELDDDSISLMANHYLYGCK